MHRTNACVWLAIAAGWSRCPLDEAYFAADPFLASLRPLWERVCATHVASLGRTGRMRPERDAVGLLADRLRQRFCGRDGILKTPQEVHIWLPAYAALTPAMHRGASAADFKAWVDRVDEHEFADEIVMVAVAIHLRL